VAETRRRWVTEHRLVDHQRPGGRKKLDGKQEAFLVALACSEAPDGQETWTMQMLADKLVGECQVSRVYEISDMSGIGRKLPFVQLAPVPGKHEQLNSTAQSMNTA
jgi:hypothetical protein